MEYLGEPLGSALWAVEEGGNVRMVGSSAAEYAIAAANVLSILHERGFTHPALHAGNLSKLPNGNYKLHDMGHCLQRQWHKLTPPQYASECRLDTYYIKSKLASYGSRRLARVTPEQLFLDRYGISGWPVINHEEITIDPSNLPKIPLAEMLLATQRRDEYIGKMTDIADRMEQLEVIIAHTDLSAVQTEQLQQFILITRARIMFDPFWALLQIVWVIMGHFQGADLILQLFLITMVSHNPTQ